MEHTTVILHRLALPTNYTDWDLEVMFARQHHDEVLDAHPSKLSTRYGHKGSHRATKRTLIQDLNSIAKALMYVSIFVYLVVLGMAMSDQDHDMVSALWKTNVGTVSGWMLFWGVGWMMEGKDDEVEHGEEDGLAPESIVPSDGRACFGTQ